MTPTLWVFYLLYSTGVLIQIDNSPIFIDRYSCEQTLITDIAMQKIAPRGDGVLLVCWPKP